MPDNLGNKWKNSKVPGNVGNTPRKVQNHLVMWVTTRMSQKDLAVKVAHIERPKSTCLCR